MAAVNDNYTGNLHISFTYAGKQKQGNGGKVGEGEENSGWKYWRFNVGLVGEDGGG